MLLEEQVTQVILVDIFAFEFMHSLSVSMPACPPPSPSPTKIETGSAIIIINMELVGVLGLTLGLDTTG